MKVNKKAFSGALTFLVLLIFTFASFAVADSLKVVDVKVDEALGRFVEEVDGAEELLGISKGFLTFPELTKFGFIAGGETGKGALRVGGETVDYYRRAGGSVGLQIGIQKFDLVIVFLTDETLEDFRQADGWEVGVDGSIALVDVGKGGSIDSTTLDKPIYAFAFGQKGLMVNLTLEGAKFIKIYE